jgi:hypothetical protein
LALLGIDHDDLMSAFPQTIRIDRGYPDPATQVCFGQYDGDAHPGEKAYRISRIRANRAPLPYIALAT